MRKTPSTFRSTLIALLPWGLFAASSLPLIILACLGTFTRYLADDYSTAGVLVNQGFWKAQAYWYQAWSGRYSFTFLVSLIELAGVRIVPWLPMLGLLLWSVSLFWTLWQLFKVLGVRIGKAWIGVLVNVVIFGAIKGFREYAQVIFWQTGILTYQISLIFITLMVGIFLTRFYLSPWRPLRSWEYALWALAFFVGGGFSETWVIVQIALLGLAFIFFLFTKNSPLRTDVLRVLFVGFLASWTALLVIAKSPGNMNRDTVMAELSFDLLRNSLIMAFRDVPVFLSEWLAGNTTLAVMLILAGLTAGIHAELPAERKTNQLRLGIFLLIGVYILLWAGFVPQYAVMNIRPAERAIFMPMALLLWVFVLCAVFAGAELDACLKPPVSQASRAILLTALALSLFWVPVRSAYSLSWMIPSLQLYAQRWDARDAVLRQAGIQGEKEVVVESLRRNPALHEIQPTFWIEGDLQDIPEHWINQVAASYYGVASIRLHR
jgi:hypothetical protein